MNAPSSPSDCGNGENNKNIQMERRREMEKILYKSEAEPLNPEQLSTARLSIPSPSALKYATNLAPCYTQFLLPTTEEIMLKAKRGKKWWEFLGNIKKKSQRWRKSWRITAEASPDLRKFVVEVATREKKRRRSDAEEVKKERGKERESKKLRTVAAW